MTSTQDFRTKTIFNKRKNVGLDDSWPIAIDIGYSGTKIMSPNGLFSFPSYAIKVSKNQVRLGNIQSTDLIFHDLETDETWFVGAMAQNFMDSDSSEDSEATLYNRKRYHSPMFKTISSVGLALGRTENEFSSPKGKQMCIQTGLPPKYIKSDSKELKKALAGVYNFELKIGKNPFVKYNFGISENDINIMPQPMGTLFSVAINNFGDQTKDSKSLFGSNVLIMDAGFGTLDIFSIKNGLISDSETFDTLGMKRVMKETTEKIFDNYGKEIPVPAIQRYLETNKIPCFDPDTMSSNVKPFDDLLDKSNKMVCMEAINKLKNTYNNLIDIDYLIVTGGTGAAWSSIIKDYFKNMHTLTIINGNKNDEIPYIFANVRGYYMYRYNKLKVLNKKN